MALESTEGRQSAAEALGAAARRLAEAIVRTETPADELTRVAARLDEITAGLDETSRDVRSLSSLVADRSGLHRPFNPISGVAHPGALEVRWEDAADGGLQARAVTGARHEGPPGMLHGDLVTALFDEVFGTLASRESRAMTVHLEVDFLAAVPLGSEVLVTARIAGTERRKLFLEGEMTIAGDTTVTSRAQGI
jgi:acyl-coenzyme A thioesterase PaaI-like protein